MTHQKLFVAFCFICSIKERAHDIEEHMLNCYNRKHGQLVRSMPLEGAVIKRISQSDHGYKHMFCVSNRSFEFRMRASSSEDMAKWVKMLTDEAESRAELPVKKRQEVRVETKQVPVACDATSSA